VPAPHGARFGNLLLSFVLSAFFAANANAGSQRAPSGEAACSAESFYQSRIVTAEEVEQGTVPSSAKFWWGMGWPCRKILGGMESGLIAFERTKLREKLYDWQRRLAEAGFRPLFGGLGEGAGIGLGTIYDYPHRTTEALHVMGRLSLLSGYQEFSANFDKTPLKGTRLNLLADYQWRPNEPFYGFGQESSYDDRSNFALRQSSFSFHWDQDVYTRIRSGVIYSAALLKSLNQEGGGRPPVSDTFGPLPGLEERVNLQSIGAYVALDGYRGDYRLGGRSQIGASWQESWGGPEVRYAKVEAVIEGRLPIVGERSVLVGQARTDMLREGSGTSPIPFYLFPRIGGSATLRGFPLDRFHGRNMILTTIEYRFLIHPNMEVEIFHDSGQIYEHTHNLSFFDWQRNYGVGFRLRSATGTQFRFELASSSEGVSVHFTFGDRPIRALGSGPVRYPLYRP
jgi:hypothetical protein